MNTHPKPQRLLYSRDDLRHIIGIDYSRAQLFKMMRSGQFPKAIRISAQRCAWVAAEIEAWLEARKTTDRVA